MIRLIAVLCLTALPAFPNDALTDWKGDPSRSFSATEIELDDFIWLARPVIIFADSPNDPRFIEQIELIASESDEAVARDLLIVTDTNPAAPSALRNKLRPRGFTFVLIGKDGGVKLRKPFPWDMREISRVIDKMPIRKREIEESKSQSN